MRKSIGIIFVSLFLHRVLSNTCSKRAQWKKKVDENYEFYSLVIEKDV